MTSGGSRREARGPPQARAGATGGPAPGGGVAAPGPPPPLQRLRHVSRAELPCSCQERRPSCSGCLALVLSASQRPAKAEVDMGIQIARMPNQPLPGGLPLVMGLLVHRPRIQRVVILHVFVTSL